MLFIEVENDMVMRIFWEFENFRFGDSLADFESL